MFHVIQSVIKCSQLILIINVIKFDRVTKRITKGGKERKRTI